MYIDIVFNRNTRYSTFPVLSAAFFFLSLYPFFPLDRRFFAIATCNIPVTLKLTRDCEK